MESLNEKLNENPHSPTPVNLPEQKQDPPGRKSNAYIFLTGFFIVAGVVVLYSLFASFPAIFSQDQSVEQQAASLSQNSPGGRKTRMGLTSFDAGLARKFMDKDNDGKCDACGMPVEMCMGSGQLQCNMDPESTIGDLGSQHIHTDWKIYINGEALGDEALKHLAMDMSKKDNPLTSSFIHLDQGAPAPEKTGDVLHMHAAGVPLWIWFESIGWKFDKDCLKAEGEEYCSDSEKTLKFYVNGQLNDEFENYVFNDGDKILISYGKEKFPEMQQQLNSITSFAERH